MLPRLALLLVYLKLTDSISSSSRYECGPHGKFEYCLDDFTECVVGCHCYPGYYFDTTTKICEPSTKLFKESRRFNNKFDSDAVDTDFELRNVRPIQVTSPASPATSKDGIDNKVEAMSKNADELSDWLYNQFFKDIESEVVNKTETIKQTRKDGSGSTWKGIKNKKKKSSKKKNSKKKKHKRDSLRRQLLRIAEDDSIFESADEGDDDDDDDEDEDEDEYDDDSEDDDKSKHNHRDEIRIIQNKDGNNKEILMLKSEPRATLPSFILLPNIESPFGMYPLALPPAPPIQMFPMAPLPPMMAPAGLPYCDEVAPVTTTSEAGQTAKSEKVVPESTLTEESKPTKKKTNKKDPNKEDPNKKDPNKEDPNKEDPNKEDPNKKDPNKEDPNKEDPNKEDPNKEDPNIEDPNKEDPNNEDPNKNDNKVLRFGGNRGRLAGRFTASRQEEKRRQDETGIDNKNEKKENLRQKPRQNFMEQLKEKRKKMRTMQSKLKQTNEELQIMNSDSNFGPQINPIVTQMEKPKENRDLLDDMVFLADEPYSMMYNNMAVKPTTEPIGFKYLSELIHRPENKPNDQQIQPLFTPSRPLPPISINENLQPYAAPLDVLSRRAPPITQKLQTNKFLIELGRQIASVIRKFEIKDLQATREIEQLRNASIPQPSVFSGNMGNYGSRSYWERSVRSPTPASQSPDDELDEKYLNSNERLLQLENKVHVVAKKLSLLELEQLERIANIMEMKKHMELYDKDKETESKPSNSSLNVSLLPSVSDTQNELAKSVPHQNELAKSVPHQNELAKSVLHQNETTKPVLHPHIQVTGNFVTNDTQLVNTKNTTFPKPQIIQKKAMNLFTPDTPAKQPYKHTWNIDGIGLSEAFPRLAVQEKNESTEKTLTSDIIRNYLANVIWKRFGSFQTYFDAYQSTSKRPLIKPVLQMHSPLKHTYRPPYYHSLTVKPSLLNMESEMNKPLKKNFVEKITTQNNKSLPKTNIPIENDRSPSEQKSYFHHDFHELDYYDRK